MTRRSFLFLPSAPRNDTLAFKINVALLALQLGLMENEREQSSKG